MIRQSADRRRSRQYRPLRRGLSSRRTASPSKTSKLQPAGHGGGIPVPPGRPEQAPGSLELLDGLQVSALQLVLRSCVRKRHHLNQHKSRIYPGPRHITTASGTRTLSPGALAGRTPTPGSTVHGRSGRPAIRLVGRRRPEGRRVIDRNSFAVSDGLSELRRGVTSKRPPRRRPVSQIWRPGPARKSHEDRVSRLLASIQTLQNEPAPPVMWQLALRSAKRTSDRSGDGPPPYGGLRNSSFGRCAWSFRNHGGSSVPTDIAAAARAGPTPSPLPRLRPQALAAQSIVLAIQRGLTPGLHRNLGGDTPKAGLTTSMDRS